MKRRETIPRFVLTQKDKAGDGLLFPAAELGGGHLATFGFTSREKVTAFMQSNEVTQGMDVTFMGHGELRVWLRSQRDQGIQVYVRDIAALDAPFCFAANVSDLIAVLDGIEDTGDDIEADFAMYTTLKPLEPH